MAKKSDTLEVKTVKTTKSDIWCKHRSKSDTIGRVSIESIYLLFLLASLINLRKSTSL